MIPEQLDILNSFTKVIQYSQDYNFDLEGTKGLFLQWRAVKERFYHYFGDQLIWRSPEPINIKLSQSAKDSLINAFETKVARLLKVEGDCEFILWIEDNKEQFFENRVTTPMPRSNMKVGSKLLRSFNYFFQGDVLRQIQDLASQFIQQDKLTGYLYLSIHPLDYLTASENNSNWRSCHALDGEYRAGNLSYMLDKTTIMAYVAPSAQVQLKNFPEGMLWNNKKWRTYLSINEGQDAIFFSKSYPFACKSALLQLLNTPPIRKMGRFSIRGLGFKEIIDSMGATFTTPINYIIEPYTWNILSTKEVCSAEEKGNLNYNDVINSSDYIPILAVKEDRMYDVFARVCTPMEILRTPMGAPVPCLKCGKKLDDSDRFLCADCYTNLVGPIDDIYFDV